MISYPGRPAFADSWAGRETLCPDGQRPRRAGTARRAPAVFKLALASTLALALADCRTEIPRAARLADMLNARVANPFDDTVAIAVNFVSNRQISKARAGCNDEYYTVELAGAVRQGVCVVNVPRGHSVGSIDTVSEGQDRNSHFIATRYLPLSEAEYDATLAKEPGDILLFVHGFNVRFQEAVFRAAQIAYDAKFQGTVVLFSWPAGPRPGFLASLRMDSTYEQNRERASRSVSDMQGLLNRLTATKRRLFVIVHSMGHQVIIPAIAGLADLGQKESIQELVFTAPDFAQADFRRLSPKIRQVARRITLYCSPADNALRVSERVNGNRRIGQCTRLEGVDVVNVSLIDSPIFWVGGLGHGYYSSRALLTDIFQLMLGLDVNKRLFVRKSVGDEGYLLRN